MTEQNRRDAQGTGKTERYEPPTVTSLGTTEDVAATIISSFHLPTPL